MYIYIYTYMKLVSVSPRARSPSADQWSLSQAGQWGLVIILLLYHTYCTAMKHIMLYYHITLYAIMYYNITSYYTII